ncbi:MAG: IS630 family transposase [Armatimonadia bacterium]
MSNEPTLRRCLRPRGPHRPLPTSLPRRVRYLHGAVSYPDGACYFREFSGMTSVCCIDFLRGLLEAVKDRPIRVICDNAPAHCSHAMARFLKDNPRLQLVYQPTYAPWTNPVERVWQEMRRAVTHCHDLPDLAAVVQTALAWCERFGQAPDAVRRLASFPQPKAS